MSTPRIPAHIVRQLAHRMVGWASTLDATHAALAEQIREASIQVYAASDDLEDARAFLVRRERAA